MNGMRLRPLGMGDIFDEGFDLYKRNFVSLLLVTAITVVPLDILLAFVSPALMRQVYDLFSVASTADALGIWFLNDGVKLTLFLPLYSLALAPLVMAASACYLQQPGSLRDSFLPVLKRLPGLFLSFLLAGMLLDLGLSFCVIGWPIAASQLVFTPQTFLLERLGPGKALMRSSSLINGYGGRIFSCLLMLGVIVWVIGLGVKLPLAYVFELALSVGPHIGSQANVSLPTAVDQTVTLLSGGVTHLLLFPFLVSVLTALYYDIRIRKEGFDIELMSRELGYAPLNTLGPFLPPVPAFTPFRPGVAVPPKRPGRRGPR